MCLRRSGFRASAVRLVPALGPKGAISASPAPLACPRRAAAEPRAQHRGEPLRRRHTTDAASTPGTHRRPSLAALWPCLAVARRLSPPGRLGGPRPEDPRRSPPIGRVGGRNRGSAKRWSQPFAPALGKIPSARFFGLAGISRCARMPLPLPVLPSVNAAYRMAGLFVFPARPAHTNGMDSKKFHS